MAARLLRVEDVLRGNVGEALGRRRLVQNAQLAGFIVFFGILYGTVMGTFAGVSGERYLQVIYSAIKVPMLLMVTFALGLPSFWVLNRLMGLGSDFAEAFRALVATQAGLTIILASLSPFTGLWYASSDAYQPAILFNGLMFAIASFSAQWLLRRYYRPLIARDRRHRYLLRLWLIIYAFVGIQMGWILRPFIGDPGSRVQFFREGALGNAYVVIAEMIWHVVRHL